MKVFLILYKVKSKIYFQFINLQYSFFFLRVSPLLKERPNFCIFQTGMSQAHFLIEIQFYGSSRIAGNSVGAGQTLLINVLLEYIFNETTNE